MIKYYLAKLHASNDVFTTNSTPWKSYRLKTVSFLSRPFRTAFNLVPCSCDAFMVPEKVEFSFHLMSGRCRSQVVRMEESEGQSDGQRSDTNRRKRHIREERFRLDCGL